MRPTVFILVLIAAAVGGSARRGVWRTEVVDSGVCVSEEHGGLVR